MLWENTHCCWVVKSYLTLWPHGVQHAVLTCPSLFPEFAQTHVHWVGDAIQPSHLRSPPSPPALNLSKNQFLFQWTTWCYSHIISFTILHKYENFIALYCLCSSSHLEKEMATHSSIVAWKILWTEEPGRLQSMGLQRVGYDFAAKTTTTIRDPSCFVGERYGGTCRLWFDQGSPKSYVERRTWRIGSLCCWVKYAVPPF